MAAPVNADPKDPDMSNWSSDEVNNWLREAVEWRALNPGNPDFYPLTIKAGYVIGVIYGICESVSCLLADAHFARQTGYIPAYGIYASGIEILGRCVKEESQGHASTLRPGFKWLASRDPTSYETISNKHTLVTTNQRAYTIEELVQLRNFAAHGQATAQFFHVDYELLSVLHPFLQGGLESFWSKLVMPGNDELSTNLAKANIIALRDWPVFECWSLFASDWRGEHLSVTEVFDKFRNAWQV